MLVLHLINNHLGELVALKLTKGNKDDGVDLGLYYFAIEPKVRNIANPRFVKHAEKNLRRKLSQLSRKAKDIENRAKARLPARSQVI